MMAYKDHNNLSAGFCETGKRNTDRKELRMSRQDFEVPQNLRKSAFAITKSDDTE